MPIISSAQRSPIWAQATQVSIQCCKCLVSVRLSWCIRLLWWPVEDLDNERQKTDQHLKHFRTDLKCLLNDNRRAKLLKTTPAARGGLNDSLLKNDNLS